MPQGPELRANLLTTELRAVRGADGKPGMLTGYAAVYDTRTADKIWGEFWEIIRRGAFANALAGKEDVRFFHSHDSSVVLGRTSAGTLRLFDDPKGLRFELDLPDTTAGRDLMVSVERKDITQMSFGFRTLKQRWTEERDPVSGMLEAVRELLEVMLLEISTVAFPAYAETQVGVREEILAECRSSRSQYGVTPAHRMRLARLRMAKTE